MKPELHLISNAHIDPYWQWEWEEGAAATVSTFRAAADCCDASDDFIFCHNEALLYQWIESFEPELFQRIQRLVKAKRWHIMGGWHLQPDCNMPCGESFIRHMLLGRSWFYEKFGVVPHTAINFDSFGHTRGLVQLLKKSGFDSYIVTRPNNIDCPLPSSEFIWVGYDGSEITVKRSEVGYNTPLGKAAEKVLEYKNKYVANKVVSMRLWGVGNHGGGPSRKDVSDLDELIRNTKDINIKHSTPEAYFYALRASGVVLPRVERDLNSWAIGCYTSQIRIKQKHRLLESELFVTEKMLATAAMQKRMVYPAESLKEVMQALATAQFHDILPGSSVQGVEEAGLRLIDYGLEILSRHKAKAFFALANGQVAPIEGEIPILIYNPHPWSIVGLFECEFMLADQNWKDEFTIAKVVRNQAELPTQVEKENSNLSLDWRKRVVFKAELAPSCMNRFDCKLQIIPSRPKPILLPVNDKFILDNKNLLVEINVKTGLLERYVVDGVDFLKTNAFQLIVINDNEDPWAMNVRSFREKIGAFTLLSPEKGSQFSGLQKGNIIESVRVLEEGEARTVIEAVFGYGDSFAVQTYKIPKQGIEMEVQVRVFWNEKDRMLKWSVPSTLQNDRCLGQVACGIESLPTTGEEFVCQQWVMLADDKRNLSLSISNDGIYGSDCLDGELRLSLLRSPSYCGHPIGERPIVPQDRFLPRIDQGERLFVFRVCGSALNSRLDSIEQEALVLNQKPMALSFFPSGHGQVVLSGVQIGNPVVQLQAIKQADDGEGWIVRIYNPSEIVSATSLKIPALRFEIQIRLAAFEVKTFRISEMGQLISEVDLMEKAPL